MWAEWKRYPNHRPSDTDEYLCVVLIPDDAGGYDRRQKVLRWESGYIGKWICENMIVTHWTDCLAFPKE